MKFQRIHNQAHQIKNGITFNITKKMAGNHFPSSSFPICMVQKISINIISTFNVKPAVGLVLLPILHKLHDLAAPGAWQHQDQDQEQALVREGQTQEV